LASSTKSGWISWRLLNNFLFYRVGLLAPRPTPIPEDQASVYPPEAGWLPILVASYDTHGLRWDYSYSPVTTRGNGFICWWLYVWKIRFIIIVYEMYPTVILPQYNFPSYSVESGALILYICISWLLSNLRWPNGLHWSDPVIKFIQCFIPLHGENTAKAPWCESTRNTTLPLSERVTRCQTLPYINTRFETNIRTVFSCAVS
jgi:hypothetical protein